jgi:hypothetical protein
MNKEWKDKFLEMIAKKNAEAILRLRDPQTFMALVSANPTIYLGIVAARQTPEKELESAIAASLAEIKLRAEAVGLEGRDALEELKAWDQLVMSLSKNHALLERYRELVLKGARQGIRELAGKTSLTPQPPPLP